MYTYQKIILDYYNSIVTEEQSPPSKERLALYQQTKKVKYFRNIYSWPGLQIILYQPLVQIKELALNLLSVKQQQFGVLAALKNPLNTVANYFKGLEWKTVVWFYRI